MKKILWLLFLICRLSYAQTNNTQIDGLMKTAAAYQQQGDNVSAVNTYLKAYSLDQKNYLTTTALADLFGQIKDYRTEIVWAQKTIAIKADYAPAYLNLGYAYLGQKDYEKANANYQQAAKFDPKDPNPVYSLGVIQQTLGNTQQAIVYYEQSQTIDPDNLDVLYNMAICYDKLKNFNEAFKCIDRYRMVDDKREVLDLWNHIKQEISAQPFAYPALPASAKSISAFVSSGWTIKGKAMGDLNGDKVADVAMILEYKDLVSEVRGENDTSQSHPRILVVLFKEGDHYKLAAQQNTFILREKEGMGMGEDPYDEPEISKGVLTINFQLLRSHLRYDFRYQADNFNLISATDAGVDANILYEWDFNFLTKQVVHTWGESTDENDHTARKKTARKVITTPGLKKLSELKKPYSWEVTKDVFI